MVKNINMLGIFFTINLIGYTYAMFDIRKFKVCTGQMILFGLMNGEDKNTYNYRLLINNNFSDLTKLLNPIFSYVKQRQNNTGYANDNDLSPRDFCQAYANTENNIVFDDVQKYKTCTDQMKNTKLMDYHTGYRLDFIFLIKNNELFKDLLNFTNPIFSFVKQLQNEEGYAISQRSTPKSYCSDYSNPNIDMYLEDAGKYSLCIRQMKKQQFLDSKNRNVIGFIYLIEKFTHQDIQILANPIFSFINQWKKGGFAKSKQLKPKEYCDNYAIPEINMGLEDDGLGDYGVKPSLPNEYYG